MIPVWGEDWDANSNLAGNGVWVFSLGVGAR